MKRELQGRYVTISTVGEKAQAFVPAPLPPRPPIDWTPELRSKFDQALLALGRLDSVSTLLPDTSLFLYMYVRKEAVLSSMTSRSRPRCCSRRRWPMCSSRRSTRFWTVTAVWDVC
jgi:hypothetical protein